LYAAWRLVAPKLALGFWHARMLPRNLDACRAILANQEEAIMIYQKQTSRSVEDAFGALQESIKKHGFGLLHHYDFRRTLAEKGYPLANECLVLEVCNPEQAARVLGMDMTLNLVLPCRMSVYQNDGKTWIGMVPPTDLLALVAGDDAVATAARSVEETMRAIIDDAV
jgi:uncharacterized protein (DUF302 family)